MRIQALPSEVVDQIAAGEVVERPAHLVKELVENALDAGATVIEVEFDQGGRRVRVTDDGRGIPTDELKLALARHATSKIAASDDLWKLRTFGFRGEALASAAAVSRLSIVSRAGAAASAARVISSFGAVSDPEAASGNPGTTVLVEELFGNVPARLKFLKSESAESSQIKNVLKAIALAHPTVEFQVRSKGKVEFAFPRAAGALERARRVLAVERLFEADGEAGGISAHAVFASPHDVTGQSRSVWIFVQGRWVQDRGLQAAVVDAYRGLLMHGEYPIAVIDVRCPPDEIDVNIHPAKSQVKFRDTQSAFRAVHRAVRHGLEAAPWLERGPSSAPVSERAVDAFGGVSEAVRAYSTAAIEPATTLAVPRPMSFDGPGFDDVRFKQSQFVRSASVASPLAVPLAEAAVRPEPGPWSRLQVLGQAKLTYILAQSGEALVLVDQHAAHERVAYERLMRGWTEGKADRQELLIPLSIPLDAERAEALEGAKMDLERLGVSLEQSGPQSVAIRSKPAAISDEALRSSLTKLASEIVEKGGGFALEKRISDMCATMACHSVVRAGQALSREQMESLLRQMDEFPLSSFCPHGRPVSVEYPFGRLERDFGRIV